MTTSEDSDLGREKSPAPAVSRAIRLLGLLEKSPGAALSLSQLAEGIGAAKSSTLNLCQALQESGMIDRVARGYRLGRRNLELGGAYAAGFNQMAEFYAFCSTPSTVGNEVVQIAMLDGTEVLYLGRHEGHTPLRFTASIGSRLPAAPTAIGNALLTTLSDEEIAARFSRPQHFPRMTENSVQSLPSLLVKVRAARERGYAVDDNEVHAGIYGVAMPIPPWSSGEPAMAIGTSLVSASVSPELITQIVSDLDEAVRRLTNPLFHPALPVGEAS